MQGVVANFVETEQIVEITTPKAKYISAFVQIRGSIPLLWSQIPSVKYKPTTRLAPPEAYRPAFDNHMTNLAKCYKVAFVIKWDFIFLFLSLQSHKIRICFVSSTLFFLRSGITFTERPVQSVSELLCITSIKDART